MSIEQHNTPDPISACASYGVLAHAAELPLGEADLLKGGDPLDDVVSAAAGLTPGQHAFICTTFREYPGFGREARAWVDRLKKGETVSTAPSSAKALAGLFRAFFWIGRRFVSEARGHHKKGGKGAQSRSQGVSTVQLSEESKLQLREAERKADDVAHFETALRLVLTGEIGDGPQLKMVMRDMERGFSILRTRHQELVFAPADPYEGLIRHMPPRAERGLLLSAPELAALAHIPDDRTRPHGVRTTRAPVKPMMPRSSVRIPDPFNPKGGLTPLGILGKSSLEPVRGLDNLSPAEWVERVVPTGSEGMRVTGMPSFDLNKHLFVSGRSGSGKSVLLEWLNFGIVKSGAGLVLVEPHGELVHNLLRMLVAHAPERVEDVVVIDLDDKDYSVAFNPLDVSAPSEIEARVGQVMEMIVSEMELAGAPRARNLVPLALTAMMEANLHLPEGCKFTLLQLTDFLLDTELRGLAMLYCTNATVLKQFAPDTGEYEKKKDEQRSDIVAPLLNRFQKLELSSSFANVFASPSNRLDFKQLLSEDKIILINTAGFGANRDLGKFIGKLVVPMVLGAVPLNTTDADGNQELRQVRLCIDEAPDLVSGDSSLMRGLAEARKFGLGIITACQYPTQFDTAVLQALMSNTSSKIAMPIDDVSQVGPMAKTLSEDGAELSAVDIKSLPNYWAYANVLQDSGTKTGPFVLSTLPPAPLPSGDAFEDEVAKVIERSRLLAYNPSERMTELRSTQTQAIKDVLLMVWERRGHENSERIQTLLTEAPDSPESPDAQPSGEPSLWDL